MSDSSTADTLNIEQLLQLHNLTKDLSKLYGRQLRGILDTVSLLFRPRRILGDAIEGNERESAGGSDKTVAELRDLYRRVAIRPFDLRPDLTFPLDSVSTQLQLYEWEYLHQINTDRGWKSIRVSSPLTWVIAYSSPYSLSMLRQVLAGKEERNQDSVRAFVLRAILMHLHLSRFPSLLEVFARLRYRIEVRHSQEFGELPLVTISAPIATMRPADSLVTVASGLSGSGSFAEVIDLHAVRDIRDPVRDEVGEEFRHHGLEI